ncbi:MAG: hypothetical protein GXP58_11495 [Deltaproteobacteria bacterium]|nr:hypothetical protein [Deltaproteobacteria bacterium]
MFEHREKRCFSYEDGFFIAIFLYFAFQSFYFALRIAPGIFPDETTHFGLAQVFAKHLIPVNSPATYRYGLVTHVPTLYYFLMGRLLALDPFPGSGLIYLRCINVVLGLTGFYFAWRWFRTISRSAAARILFLLLLANTLMYSFLAGAVSYDNLTNLLAVVTLYGLTAYAQNGKVGQFLLFTAALLAGCLSKTSFLPYAFALALAAAAVMITRNRAGKKNKEIHLFRNPFSARSHLLPVVLVVLLLTGNVVLYGGNLIRYHHLVPGAMQILTEDQAMQNRIFARDRITDLYRRGKISWEQAVGMLPLIRNRGDRASAYYGLEISVREKRHPTQRKDRLTYAFIWSKRMLSLIHGIAAHRMMQKEGYALTPYILLWLLLLGRMTRRIRESDLAGWAIPLVLLSAFYILILMQVVNYNSYLKTSSLYTAVQGRYLFPVIVPIYGLMAHYLTDGLPRYVRWGAVLIIGAGMIYAGFPWFLSHAGPEWFIS